MWAMEQDAGGGRETGNLFGLALELGKEGTTLVRAQIVAD